MIEKVFVDSDVILDVALAREPFFSSSKMVLAMAENNISSNCVANLYYILRKIGGDAKSRKFISNIVKYMNVIEINHNNVLEALKSSFSDFEDALQYFSALENDCKCIITRNVLDYKKSKIKIMLPEEFIKF